MGAGLSGMISTGLAINVDLKNGVTDRFRSLPISRLAPLLGSVMADVVRYLLAVAILFILGTLLGFRVHGGGVAAITAVGLAILFGFFLSWVTVLVGVIVRSADAVLAVGFLTFLPLQNHPNLKAIVSPTTVGIAAAARYISSSSYKGKVAVTGLGTPNQMRAYVKDGTATQFALWNPADIGTLAAYAGAALASGQITGAQGEKFTAGALGEYTIGAKGEIVLGLPTVFTKDNIDQFNF